MKRIYLHPLPVRIWHWINAFGFLTLISSGVQIRYLDYFQVLSFKTAVVIHNWTGFVLIANFFLWLGFYLFTDKIVAYLPEMNAKKFFESAWRQLKFYGYGIFLGEENPHQPTMYHKFNALQIMMYQILMLLLVPIQFISGLLLWDVHRFAFVVGLLGGVRVLDTIHVLLFIVFSGFLILHLYLITLGHTKLAHIKTMVTGYEEIPDHPKM